jgi:hypothetical protein
MQNGEINFEFIPDNEDDEEGARQATNMVHKIVNQSNDPHKILQHWIMDALLHKNGEMLVQPFREQITRYVKTQGTDSQLQAFEAQAAEAGLTATRTSKRKSRVDFDTVRREMTNFVSESEAKNRETALENYIKSLKGELDTEGPNLVTDEENPLNTDSTDELMSSIGRNTIFDAEYKLVGYNLNIRFRPIAQHYWMCDPTVIDIQDQPFCGFYDPMTIQEATERYPDLDLAKFMEHAEYSWPYTQEIQCLSMVYHNRATQHKNQKVVK